MIPGYPGIGIDSLKQLSILNAKFNFTASIQFNTILRQIFSCLFSGSFSKIDLSDESIELFFIPSGACYNQGWSFINNTIFSILEFSNSTNTANQTTMSLLTERKLDQLYLENCNISLIENNKLENSPATFPSNTATSQSSPAWEISPATTPTQLLLVSSSPEDSEVRTTSTLTPKSIWTTIERK